MSRMSLNTIPIVVGLSMLTIVIGAPLTSAIAQTVPGAPYAPRLLRARPHIVITPRPFFYRRCIDWLELQYRQSGTVLYPQYRCWWARR